MSTIDFLTKFSVVLTFKIKKSEEIVIGFILSESTIQDHITRACTSYIIPTLNKIKTCVDDFINDPGIVSTKSYQEVYVILNEVILNCSRGISDLKKDCYDISTIYSIDMTISILSDIQKELTDLLRYFLKQDLALRTYNSSSLSPQYSKEVIHQKPQQFETKNYTRQFDITTVSGTVPKFFSNLCQLSAGLGLLLLIIGLFIHKWNKGNRQVSEVTLYIKYYIFNGLLILFAISGLSYVICWLIAKDE